MSVHKPRAGGDEAAGSDELGNSARAPVLPTTASALLRWLDEQPRFIECEREYTLSQYETRDGEVVWTATDSFPDRRLLQAVDRTQHALVHVDAAYEPSSRKSFDSQRDVADAWEAMQFPTHNVVDEPGRFAAELYTLSSYTTDIAGPSTRARFVGWGRMAEEPAASTRCTRCSPSTAVSKESTAAEALSGGYRSTSLAEHFEENHPDVDLREVATTRWGGYSGVLPPEDDFDVAVGKRVTESEQNFAGYQYPDGSGELVHYNRTEAIRTRSGLVLSNSQCFAKGRARCTQPSDTSATLPLTGMRAMLADEDPTLYDISEVLYDQVRISTYGDSISRYGPRLKESPIVAVFEDGSGLAIVHDETAQNHHEKHVGFRLTPEQVDSLRQAEDVTERLLKPVEVSQFEAHGGEVVGANRFQFANGANGYYDAERLGEVAVRQGEWYFIPQDEHFEPDAPVYHYHQRGGWDLGPVGGLTEVDGVPAECAECGATSFEVHSYHSTCADCGHRHVDQSRSTEFSGLLSEDKPFNPDALGSHRPSHLAITEDGEIYVRGSVRHINQEHPMVNFRDIWHRAVENSLDGAVFDTSAPDRASGRSGGSIARYE
jgi:ribosomal protein L37E